MAKVGPKEHVYEYEGKHYTYQELAVLSGYSYNRVRQKLQSGTTIEELLKGKPNKSKVYDWGTFVGTVEQAAQHFHIKVNTLRSRLYEGYSPAEAANPIDRKKPGRAPNLYTVTIDDTQYEGSLPELAEQFNIPYQTLLKRLQEGYPLDAALTKPTNTFNYGKADPIKVYGEEMTVLAAAKKYKISYRSFIRYLERGISPEDAIYIYRESLKEPNPALVEDITTIYNQFAEKAKELGTTPTCLARLIDSNGMVDAVKYLTHRYNLRKYSTNSSDGTPVSNE